MDGTIKIVFLKYKRRFVLIMLPLFTNLLFVERRKRI